MDWGDQASGPLASTYARGVAFNVIELVRLLTIHARINRARLHLVGFGLGAHVVGFVGREYRTNLPVARITGEFYFFLLWTQLYENYLHS